MFTTSDHGLHAHKRYLLRHRHKHSREHDLLRNLDRLHADKRRLLHHRYHDSCEHRFVPNNNDNNRCLVCERYLLLERYPSRDDVLLRYYDRYDNRFDLLRYFLRSTCGHVGNLQRHKLPRRLPLQYFGPIGLLPVIQILFEV